MKLLDRLSPLVGPSYAWLGRQKGWLKFLPADFNGVPGTNLKVDTKILRDAPGSEPYLEYVGNIEQMLRSRAFMAIVYTEMLGAYFTTGPKRFVPTDEQWESMENVELNIPVSDFASPYPCLEVVIPLGCRARLARELGLDAAEMPKSVLVRWRKEPDENALIVVQAGDPVEGRDVTYVFQDQVGNETVEKALSRDADHYKHHTGNGPMFVNGGDLDTGHSISLPSLFRFGHIAARASMNLCLMLTHFGCELSAPPKKLNRKARRDHQFHGDVRTVTMKQQIVVRRRAEPTANPQGPGTGIEMTPHWRRGHWRAYPGQAAWRAAGETVQLLFVRPCLVRADRATGDLSESSATYFGS